MSPHVTSFCGCVGLEGGARVVGAVHAVTALVLGVVCAVLAQEAAGGAGGGDVVYARARDACIVGAAFSAAHLALAAVLLYGVHRRSVRCVRAWVLVTSVVLVLSLLVAAGSAAVTGLRGTGSHMFLAFLEGVLFYGAVLYCVVCVHSYYLLLRSAEPPPPAHAHY